MDTIPLKPERKAQLEEYAKRRGHDPDTALDDALATYLEWVAPGLRGSGRRSPPRLRRCESRPDQTSLRISRGPAPQAGPLDYVDPRPDACAFNMRGQPPCHFSLDPGSAMKLT